MTAAGILDGIKVVDMTQYLAGPAATRLLAEMGADIVKIEQAPGGDPARTYGIRSKENGRSGYYVQQNRGKKSLCIDFDDPAGRKVLDELIAQADVLVSNYGPGVLERRNLDWEHVSRTNPRLVMATISGFGQDSAWSDRPAFDMIAQAVSGSMHMTGEPDGPPMATGHSYADVMSGVHAATAIGYALFHRERTGRGQFIDISMVDALFHAQELAVQGPSLTGMRWKAMRHGHISRVAAPVGTYKGPEGWIVIQCMESQWPRLLELIGHPELAEDERFAELRARTKNGHLLEEIINEWMAGFDTDDEVLELLAEARVPSAPVLAPHQAIGHPYFESRGSVREVHDPLLGDFHIPGDPLRYSEFPEPLQLVAPTLGQHNHEILGSLGYEPAEIAAMEAAGVLRSGDI